MTSLNTQPQTFDLRGFISTLADAIRKLVEIVKDTLSSTLQLANWGISLANPTMKGIARLIEDMRNAGFYLKGFGDGLLIQFKEESVWAEFPYAEEIISVASGYTQRFGTSSEVSQKSGEEDAKSFLSWMGIGQVQPKVVVEPTIEVHNP